MKNKFCKILLTTALSLSMVVASAGAVFASEPPAPTDEPVVVTTGAELDAAIKSLTGAGNVVISLANDIDAITSATYTGYTAGAKLTINGNGHTINGNGVNDTGLRFGARGQALDLTITNTTFTNMVNDDRHGGGAIGLWSGALVVSGSAFTNNAATGGIGGAIRHQGGSSMSISDSTFTGNSAIGAGGALNLAVPGTLSNITVTGNTGTSSGGGIAVPNGRNGAAPAAVSMTGSTVSGNAPDNVMNVIDGGGNVFGEADVLGIVRSAESTNSKAVFDLVANFGASEVNLVEASINYDPEKYDLADVVPVEGTAVQIVKKDEASGQVQIVIGIEGKASLGHSSTLVLASISLTPKAGVDPEIAFVEITASAAYAAGEVVDITVSPRDASSDYSYRDRLDVNNDGEINAADLSLVLYYFGTDVDELPGDIKADVNGDGAIDTMDITELVNALYA